MNLLIRTTDLLPVPYIAGKNVADVGAGESGDWVSGVEDDGDAVGAESVRLQLNASFFGLLKFIGVGRPGSGSDVARFTFSSRIRSET